LLSILLVAGLAGCSSTGTNVTQHHDPLLNRTPPSSIAAPAPQTAGGPVTPVPSSSNPGQTSGVPTSSNPATLAGASWQPPLGRPLAINDNNSTGPAFYAGQLTSTSRTPHGDAFLPPNPNPKVEPVPDVHAAPSKVAPTSNWGGPPTETPTVKPVNAMTPGSADGLYQQLKNRGVVDQKVDTTPEGLHLTCYVSRGPSGGLRILEVTAADYPAAAQAILKQLDAPR